ncbi:hypothetical protein GCM10009613_25890 [Pseudonocardia kongjuensis]|uniref:DUF2637 domain-containing protein n=1 Tax=Pseudonocardia kongjuensis TaxID=102227 RepID=A0ABN1XRW0_9PSEU
MWPRKSAQSLQERATVLAAEAEHSAKVRELSTHPDVVALQVERVRGQVNRLMWTGIVLGMAFCMTNVQEFGAEGAEEWSPGWWAAWLLDPMVSLVLIAVVLAEQTTSRWQLATPVWARRARWATLGATYAMNTWKAWGALDPGQILLHSVPPLVVFVATEAAPELRDRLTAAVKAAAADSGDGPVTVAEAAAAAGIAPAAATVVEAAEPQAGTVHEGSDAGTRVLPADGAGGGTRWEREDLLSAEREVRVEQVKDLIRGGLIPSVELTGSQVGAIFGQSPRTGRRDIEDAERELGMAQNESSDAQHRPAGMSPDSEHDSSSGGAGALVLVGPDRGVTLGVGA